MGLDEQYKILKGLRQSLGHQATERGSASWFASSSGITCTRQLFFRTPTQKQTAAAAVAIGHASGTIYCNFVFPGCNTGMEISW